MRVALTSQKRGNILNEYIILHASSVDLWYSLVCTCFSFFISIELVTKRNRYNVCATILLILQMMIDLETLLMSIFRLGLFLDEPPLFISSGREELYIEITLFPTKSFPAKLFRFLQEIKGSSFL